MIVELSGGIVLPVEVADLVAEGLTNQAIARRLSVAPRTAEAHVENIRRKLEVRSRAQIAAWVTEHRLRLDGSVVHPMRAAGCGRPGREVTAEFAGSSPDGRPLPRRPSVKACQKL